MLCDLRPTFGPRIAVLLGFKCSHWPQSWATRRSHRCEVRASERRTTGCGEGEVSALALSYRESSDRAVTEATGPLSRLGGRRLLAYASVGILGFGCGGGAGFGFSSIGSSGPGPGIPVGWSAFGSGACSMPDWLHAAGQPLVNIGSRKVCPRETNGRNGPPRS